MSLNKFKEEDIGVALELEMGCANCEVLTDLLVEGRADLRKVVFNDLVEADEAEISGLMKVGVIQVDDETTLVSFNSATSNINIGAADETKVINVLEIGDNFISKDDGKEGEVLTTNGENLWQMLPLKFRNTYGYSYTDEASPVFQVPNKTVGVYERANKFGNVETDFSSGLYSQGFQNNVIISESGWYRVDGNVELVQEAKDAEELKVHMTILLDGVKPPQNKEIIKESNVSVPTSISFSEVVRIDGTKPDEERSVAVGIAWSSDNVAAELPFKINFWKMTFTRVGL